MTQSGTVPLELAAMFYNPVAMPVRENLAKAARIGRRELDPIIRSRPD